MFEGTAIVNDDVAIEVPIDILQLPPANRPTIAPPPGVASLGLNMVNKLPASSLKLIPIYKAILLRNSERDYRQRANGLYIFEEVNFELSKHKYKMPSVKVDEVATRIGIGMSSQEHDPAPSYIFDHPFPEQRARL
ncbi:hypothetical protein BFJ72_g12635 [Fusarium proliferatum]|uniref:Uncharacterized protein n=1 Tax=Gibberella intermedia TaxID=948311 RepID=A0A420SFY9_GIBIN|nr:hypothetical protein BFJ72_g12635 [Fusarium proliferatum]